MEHFDQGYGYIIYETDLFTGNCGVEVILPEIHDTAHVYVNGEYVKSFFRHDDEKSFDIEKSGWNKLQIVVENLGRVNYGMNLADHKGLVGDIIVTDKEIKHRKYIHGYKVYSLTLDILPDIFAGKAEINTPAFYKFRFNAEKPQDTLIHFEGFTRGNVFINGFNLGRHWKTELDENRLFLPAPLIRAGENEIIIFDVLATADEKKVTLHG